MDAVTLADGDLEVEEESESEGEMDEDALGPETPFPSVQVIS